MSLLLLLDNRKFHIVFTVKQVNNLHLQNMVMQMRKVCSHPFLFDWPIDPMTNDPIVNEELVNASGKMMVLDHVGNPHVFGGNEIVR